MHGPQQEFKCPHCNKTLIGRQSFRNHIKRHKGEAEIYHCETCEYSTPFSHGLRRHMAWKHTFTIEKIKCEKCNITIAKRNFKEHLKRHQGVVKNYECSKCKMRFQYPSHLKRHEATHIKRSPKPKIWACTVCEKSYGTKGALTQHMGVHEQKLHPCNICQKQFSLKTYLFSHMRRVHTKKQVKI